MRILNQMVKYEGTTLDRTFSALADPTRRAILATLMASPGASISEIAEPFGVTLPAIMKHLAVLTDAGLVMRTKSGRTVACSLTPAPMEDAVTWLNNYSHYWNRQLDKLAAFVEEEECPSPSKPAQASPSNATSKRSPKKSSLRGRSPKR